MEHYPLIQGNGLSGYENGHLECTLASGKQFHPKRLHTASLQLCETETRVTAKDQIAGAGKWGPSGEHRGAEDEWLSLGRSLMANMCHYMCLHPSSPCAARPCASLPVCLPVHPAECSTARRRTRPPPAHQRVSVGCAHHTEDAGTPLWVICKLPEAL